VVRHRKKNPEQPTDKQQRLNHRREQQETQKWKTNYNARAQIEGTIGSVKRLTGMVRLRYRGQKSVFSAIELKLTGWNIARAQASEKMQQKLAKIIARRGALALARVLLEYLAQSAPVKLKMVA